MHTKLQLLEGIVLGSREYGEADKIITVFTKERGKVSGIAKGVKKPTSRKRASLQVFTRIKFQITKGDLGIVTEVKPIFYFENLRTDLKNVAVGYFLCEAVNKSLPNDSRHPEVFELLLESLQNLEKGGHTKQIKEKFIGELLVELGFVPFGQKVNDPTSVFEDIVERKLGSVRVGRMIQ